MLDRAIFIDPDALEAKKNLAEAKAEYDAIQEAAMEEGRIMFNAIRERNRVISGTHLNSSLRERPVYSACALKDSIRYTGRRRVISLSSSAFIRKLSEAEGRLYVFIGERL